MSASCFPHTVNQSPCLRSSALGKGLFGPYVGPYTFAFALKDREKPYRQRLDRAAYLAMPAKGKEGRDKRFATRFAVAFLLDLIVYCSDTSPPAFASLKHGRASDVGFLDLDSAHHPIPDVERVKAKPKRQRYHPYRFEIFHVV